MAVSVFDLFSIGIGPSSSHTVGPMRAAYAFAQYLQAQGIFAQVDRVEIELYGSLALTGHGHGTDLAVILGLSGEQPETADPALVQIKLEHIRNNRQINLLAQKIIPFVEETDLIWHRSKVLPMHSNGMCFSAFGADGLMLAQRVYYSIGGGFIVDQDAFNKKSIEPKAHDPLPYPFHSGKELLHICEQNKLAIHEVMWANEQTWRDPATIRQGLLNIWAVMDACIDRGCHGSGMLPGSLKVRRRAPALFQKLSARAASGQTVDDMSQLSLYAIAVNEENAAGGRVVTAPTNGAAGIIPAVLKYYLQQNPEADDSVIVNYLLTAAAVGILYKECASLSAAEVGCQGEVGVACSMAAAGFAAISGGSVMQVENAAEIGMEHHLGLTCDPIAGLVQIPCIERNAMGSVQAVNSARLALLEDGTHIVSLDDVIETMRQTGKDMLTKYKETSQGGLAVNVPEC